MGLDIFVGPLSRYYSGNWETILQQCARQSGLTVQVVRPTQPKPSLFLRLFRNFRGRFHPTEPAAVVANWRAALPRYGPPGALFEWADSPNGDYFTDKPAWDCYGALHLWASYDESPPVRRLSAATDKWSNDPTYLAAVINPSSRYRHLIANTELWLPFDFDTPFTAPMPAGDPAVIGSTMRLLSELSTLNENTWQATSADLERWRHEGAEYGAPLERSAMFGFAVFHSLTTIAVDRHLPMKLDY